MDVRLRSRPSAQRRPVHRPVNYCAQCGELMFMPEWSEHLNERRVRHLWSCDACGYRFETVVVFREP